MPTEIVDDKKTTASDGQGIKQAIEGNREAKEGEDGHKTVTDKIN